MIAKIKKILSPTPLPEFDPRNEFYWRDLLKRASPPVMSDGSAVIALEKLQMFERSIKSETLTGREKALFDLDTRVIELGDQLSELAKAAGVDPSQYSGLINEFAGQRRKLIDEQFAPKEDAIEERGSRFRFDYASRLTGLERMGLVMQSGVMGGFDPNRSTEQNTRATVSELKTTNKLLGKLSSPDHANI